MMIPIIEDTNTFMKLLDNNLPIGVYVGILLI